MNFVIAGNGYAKGTELTDPPLPLDNANDDSYVAVFAYATTRNVLGNSPKFDVIVPYVSLEAKGPVFGRLRERYVTGFADPVFRFLVNFVGLRRWRWRNSRTIARI